MLQSREGGTDLVVDRPDLPALRDPDGRLQGRQHHDARRRWPARRSVSWLGGNEPELFAALTKASLDPTKENVIKQNFDMSGLLKGDLDVAQAMIYNEYAQVLEAKNPATGELYTARGPERHRLQRPVGRHGDAPGPDLRHATSGSRPATTPTSPRSSCRRTFKGWIYCRDNAQKCVDIVLAKGSQLGASHQAWQMNEINALIWPSPDGIGLLDKALYDQTIDIATTYKVLKAAPSADATRTDLAQKALDALGTSVDTKGASFAKGTVTLKEGGN